MRQEVTETTDHTITDLRNITTNEFLRIVHTQHPDTYVASGADSYVLKVGNKVYKYYLANPHNKEKNYISRIKKYKETTNRLAHSFNSENASIVLPTSNINIKLAVNPVDELFWSENLSCFVTVSNLVPGFRLSKVLMAAIELSGSHGSDLSRIYSYYTGRMSIIAAAEKLFPSLNFFKDDHNDLVQSLRALTRSLVRLTRTDWICLHEYNIKFNPAEEKIQLMITDLSTRLDRGLE